jgi:endoglucanase
LTRDGAIRAILFLSIGIAVFQLITFLAAQSTPKEALQLTGVNIAGGEFAPQKIPGEFNHDYTYPEAYSINYFADKGVNVVRLPVLWERMQRQVGTPIDDTEMQRIDVVVGYARSKQIKLIIDVHNYASYFGASIGTQETPTNALGNLWRQIAMRYKDNASVIFGLMNEPTGLSTKTWLDAANSAIAEIRQVGANNLILVPGNGWSSARDWMSSRYGAPNSQEMLNVIDPRQNYAFDVHQYLDQDFAGTHADCQGIDIGVDSLVPFTSWAREHRRRGFLGEFGVGTNLVCLDALDRILRFLAANDDVWLGWTYWAGGTWWPKEYFTNLEPLNGKDRPQMAVLGRYLAGPRKSDKK